MIQVTLEKEKLPKTVKIAIVGADGRKWTEEQEGKAKDFIHKLLSEASQIEEGILSHELIVISGHCHLGGIDIWAEEIAKELGIKTLIYPAEVCQWEDKKTYLMDRELVDKYSKNFEKQFVKLKGFRSRNIKIAEACGILYDIEPAGKCKYCGGSGAGKDNIGVCNRCGGDGAYSGGTWVYKYLKKHYPNKEAYKIIIGD